MYYEFEEAVAKLAGHRILALNRGEKEKFLTVKVEAPEEDILRYLERKGDPYRESLYNTGIERDNCRQLQPSDRTGY